MEDAQRARHQVPSRPIAKRFTAALILQLAHEGKLTVDYGAAEY